MSDERKYIPITFGKGDEAVIIFEKGVRKLQLPGWLQGTLGVGEEGCDETGEPATFRAIEDGEYLVCGAWHAAEVLTALKFEQQALDEGRP